MEIKNNNYFPQQKIEKILRSAMQTDYYKKLFEHNNLYIEDIRTPEEFSRIPITTKMDYRDHVWGMINDLIVSQLDMEFINCNKANYKLIDSYLEKYGLNLTITSGSTGTPLDVIRSANDNHRNYFALNRYRLRKKGFSPIEPYIWLLPMNSMTKSYFYESSTNYIKTHNGFDYFLTDYHDKELYNVYEFINKEKIQWATGSPTCLYEYAMFIKRHGLIQIFSYIELHSEPLFEWQKVIIKSTFGVEPVCVYGSNEVLFIAATCEYGHYHVLDDNVYLELTELEVPGTQSKKVLLTSLNSFDCPVIRYDIGDVARFSNVPCSCGKSSLLLTGYRDSDLIYIEDHVFEPYIIYDSIYFMEKEFDIKVDYYWVEQVASLCFIYTFCASAPWLNLENAICQYLQSFLCSSFGINVKIEIKFCNETTLRSEFMRRKYKRFTNLKHPGK